MLVVALAALQMTFADEVITQDPNRLPLTARNFINQYFTNPQYSYIKVDDGFLEARTYEVRLGDDTEIDFDKNGDWESVDCQKKSVPEALVPQYVKNYVKNNFSGEKITKIEREGTHTEVELSNEVSLQFNDKGELIDSDN